MPRTRTLVGSIAALAAIGITSVAGGQTGTVLIPGTAPAVDYHAEGQITAGNVHIRSTRAPDEGQALATCDPDPRQAPNVRPDCRWSTPAGAGEDWVDLNGQVGEPDTDSSPNGEFTPVTTDTREDLDGEGGLRANGAAFLTGELFEDEDMRFRLVPRSLDGYVAPEGNANNRWRRLCGTAVVRNADGAARSPFISGQVRQFVLQIWDADWRDPSDNDGGNQDYWVLDVVAPGSVIDTRTCDVVPGRPPFVPGDPTQTPAEQQAAAEQLAQQQAAAPEPGTSPSRNVPVQRLRGAARLSGRNGCARRSFKATVVGENIAQVAFSVDGRRIKTLLRPNDNGRWSARIVPRSLRVGRHRVVANVSFVTGATPRTRQVRLTFARCAQAQRPAGPRFTG